MSLYQDLQLLVHSLEKSEKKLFSELAEREAYYYKLYTYINSNPGSSETEAGQALGLETKDRSFVHAKAYLQRHLHQLLLNARSQDNPRHLLLEQFRLCELLYYRGLYLQSLKLIGEHKQQARDRELLDLHLQYLDLERKVTESVPENPQHSRKLRAISAEIADTYKALQQLLELEDILREIEQHILAHALVSRGDNPLNAYLDRAVMKEAPLRTYNAQHMYHTIHLLVYMNSQQFSNASLHATQLEQLMTRHSHIWEATPERFISFFANLKRAYFWDSRHEDNLRMVQQMYTFLDKHPLPVGLKTKTLGEVYNTHLISLHELHEWQKGAKLAPQVETFLAQNGQISNNISNYLSYNLAYGYFYAGNYRKALEHLKTICNKSPHMVRDDLYLYAHTFMLMVLCGLQDWEVLEYRMRSVHRMLVKANYMLGSERLIFRFCKECLKKHSYPDEAKLELYLQEAERLSTLDEEQASLKYFNLSDWFKMLLGKPL